MITPQDKHDIDQALDEVEEAIRRHNQWLEEQINKLQEKQRNAQVAAWEKSVRENPPKRIT